MSPKTQRWPIELTGRVEDHALIFDYDALKAELATARNCIVAITIERKHARRSEEQSRYYWGKVIAELVEHTGYRDDEIHDYVKRRFLPKHLAFINKNGTIIGESVVGGSTTKLNKVEFYDYVENIRQWALDDLDVFIEPPDPNWRDAKEAQGDPEMSLR